MTLVAGLSCSRLSQLLPPWPMTDPTTVTDPRLELIVERAYAVSGVIDVRAWLWNNTIYVGIRVAALSSGPFVKRQVEVAVAALAEESEVVEVGFLAHD